MNTKLTEVPGAALVAVMAASWLLVLIVALFRALVG